MRSTQDIGSELKSRACGLASATAGGTGDGTAVTGATIDRAGFGSAQLVAAYKASLTADKTLSIAAEIQDSADGTNWNTATALYTSTVVETGVATNKVGEKRTNIDLSGYARYVRVNFTPDLSNSGTDTAIVAATLVLGGATTLPAS